MDYILDFEDLDKHSFPLVGGKNAGLGEMMRAGIRVPPGFAVTTEGYLDFIAEAGIGPRICRRQALPGCTTPTSGSTIPNGLQRAYAAAGRVCSPPAPSTTG